MSEVVEEKTLNPEIKEWMFRSVPRMLESIRFIKVFGINYVRPRMRESIKNVYTNELETALCCAGYYKWGDSSITLCKASSDGGLLREEDLLNRPYLKHLILHEAIHGILRCTPRECMERKIKYGTGLLECYVNEEHGRGLNEGFTDWLCDRSFVPMDTGYNTLKKFISLLEIAVGPEKVLKMGKGDLLGKIPSLLGITQEDVKYLVIISDELYWEQDKIRRYSKIVNILSNYNEENKEYKNSQPQIDEVREDEDFIDYINKKNLDDSDESIIKYLNEKLEELRKNERRHIISFESKVLDLYFMKDFEKIFNKDGLIDEKDYKKVFYVMQTLNSTKLTIPEQEKQKASGLSVFRLQEKFIKFQDKYMKQYAAELAKKYKKRNYSLRDLIGLGLSNLNIKEIQGRNITDNPDIKDKLDSFLYEISKQLDPDIADSIYKIISYIKENLYNPQERIKFEGSKVYKLVSEDKSVISAVLFNNGNYKDFEKIDKDSDTVNLDITLSPGEEGKKEYDSAVQNFLELRQKILSKNPNSEIYIASNNIIVKDGENTLYYHIHKGEIIPMSVAKKIDINVDTIPKLWDKIIGNPYIIEKLEEFSNFINRIKNRLFGLAIGRAEEPHALQEADTTLEETESNSNNGQTVSKSDGFDERIKVSEPLTNNPDETAMGAEGKDDDELEM